MTQRMPENEHLTVDGVEVEAGDVVTVEYENEEVGSVLEREGEEITNVCNAIGAMPDYIQFAPHDAINKSDIVSVEKHD